jgi:hypothetical protein
LLFNVLLAGGACVGPSFVGELVGLVIPKPMLMQTESGGSHLRHVSLDFEGPKELSSAVGEVTGEAVFVVHLGKSSRV